MRRRKLPPSVAEGVELGGRIATVNRCTTQKQGQHQLFQQRASGWVELVE